MLTRAQSLMVAVLEQAIIDLQSRRYAVRQQAKSWLFARGVRADHLFSFERICQEFRRSPIAARRRILAIFAANPEAPHQVQERKHAGAA